MMKLPGIFKEVESMDGNDPLIADDVTTDEERLEKERMLRRHGMKPGELSAEEADDLADDIRGDSNRLQDTDEELSDVVTPEENDGND